MDNKELFLIEEYKSAVTMTFEMDNLRNKLTSFFISIAGVAIAGFLLLLKNDVNPNVQKINSLVAFFLILISIIGHLFVCVLAKIRRAQLEYFRIINNIRTYFLENDYALWNVVQLSSRTLPVARTGSGTYFWLLIIQILNAFILFLGILLLFNKIDAIISTNALFISIAIILSLYLQHKLYFYMTRLENQLEYSEDKRP